MRSFSYDEEYYNTDTGDYVHIDDLPDLDHAKDFLGGIVEAIYETGDLDLLQHCLEELCVILDVNIPEGKLRIKRI